MTARTPQRFVIVGAGQAGGWAAVTLRGVNQSADIVLIGDEPHPPHERPPLSKEVLLGLKPAASAYIHPDEKLAALSIERRCARVESIDRAAKQVVLKGGASLPYDGLLLALGGRVRRLSVHGATLAGVHYLRTIDDSLAIGKALVPNGHLLIVGGGWIGLEVASAGRQAGACVTIVEAAERLCARALPVGDLATYLLDLHRRNGVDVLLNSTTCCFGGTDKVDHATLSTGEWLPVSAAVIGIGVVPNVELAREAGLTVDDGIVVDEFGRTSDPSIFAAGDCTNQPNDFLGRRVRLESWANAQNQAIAAAKAMASEAAPYQEIPWFWSDQHGVNVQLLGLPQDFDAVVLRGNPKRDRFMQFYLANDRIVAVAAVNNGRELRAAKRLMLTHRQISSVRLADEDVGLNQLA